MNADKFTRIRGFEDYGIVVLPGRSLIDITCGYDIARCFEQGAGESYVINRNLPVEVSNAIDTKYIWVKKVTFRPELAVDHKELLDTAQKVFTHPSCKMSRSMMAERYKKSLNPFLADVVVIPHPDYGMCNLYKYALFINDAAKMIVKINVDNNDDATARIEGAREGDKLKEFVSLDSSVWDIRPNGLMYSISDMLDAELFYYGEMLFIPSCQSWLADALSGSLPLDRVVFEESVQESLGNDENRLDFDSLCSIKEMLESSDENTVSAGLKALSMMDWMHYPQSVKFILNNADRCHWLYNKACNSTSFKYMMNVIAGNDARRRCLWPGRYGREIREEDFELFKRLKCRYHALQPDQVLDAMKSVEFMHVNSEGILAPRIMK